MFRIILISVFIISAWLWSDWRNWREYYPTILYFMVCSFLYTTIFHYYPLWMFEPIPPIHNILHSNTLITIVVTFTVFPATALIYLTHYPKRKLQYIYIAIWVVIYSIIELISIPNKAISYHNGWAYPWSIAFNILLFSLLRLHHLRPLLAWGISCIFIIITSAYFKLPYEMIR